MIGKEFQRTDKRNIMGGPWSCLWGSSEWTISLPGWKVGVGGTRAGTSIVRNDPDKIRAAIGTVSRGFRLAMLTFATGQYIGHPSIVLSKDAESLAKPTRILDVACSQGNTDDPLPTAREAIGSVICHDSRPRTLSRNLQLIDKLEETTQRTGCRSGQLIMAWSTNQAEDIIAITLIKRIKYLQEKIGSLDVN
uniref:Putative aldo-keto reductase n=1 Tax=Cladonia uncialis subsp. uncialis TaxID=180999 RepID=A0A2K9YDF8_CLAUC|nr:putative aldo-keto reductase [Cladonia uncialis subsp. uncialis]